MSVFLRAVRRMASLPGFRRLTSVTPLLRFSFALRATLVDERWRFVRNELRRRPITAVYHLRSSGIAVALRHHSGDILVLDEIFSQREYDAPVGAQHAMARLGSEPRVVDLGANIGLFGAWLLERAAGARILAVEADPANAAVHRQTIQANRAEQYWRLIDAFAGREPGVTRFKAGGYALSRASDAPGAIDVHVIDVLPELLEADLIKIDIEGAEWSIVADARFVTLRAEVIILEYHRDGCPGADPAKAAADALRSAGYEELHTGRKPAFGAGVVWGVRS